MNVTLRTIDRIEELRVMATNVFARSSNWSRASSGWVTIPKMFRAGVMLDLIALFIVPAMVYVLGSLVLDFGS